ncbi:IS110 family transposase [Pasteurella skyensis]|uniref:IS110 family transposase n=1 Tax=Phocoenobacter skyensis TaxID=97481 RepID=UPI00278D35FC|nr:IS110 family transposase [Pasteurella skyensis]MDP8171319.1 IS110 family transposase [Pasteurella skyensis]
MTYKVYVGIDVSKFNFDVAWVNKGSKKPKTKQFTNDTKGFDIFHRWIIKQSKKEAKDILVLMEATGVYHENLAYALYDMGFGVSIINPTYVKQFASAIGNHSKTDKQDAKVLAQYASIKEVRLWEPEPEDVRYLKQLIARLDALEMDKQREKNRLEKLLSSKNNDAFILESLQDMLKNFDEAIEKIEAKINEHIDNNPDLKSGFEHLISIPGIGEKVAPRVLNLLKSKQFQSASECAAFVGLTPVQRQSGLMKGKPRISKKGNSTIRSKLYMCAMSAIKYNPDIKVQYERLLANGKCKKAALIAAMRKLLQICYGVIKHNSNYQPQIN